VKEFKMPKSFQLTPGGLSVCWESDVTQAQFELLRRYELAQRARARNLVHWLRYKATLEFDVAMGLWSGVRVDDALTRSKSRKALANRIAAKYLGGNGQ
jgi:hypothetical protein